MQRTPYFFCVVVFSVMFLVGCGTYSRVEKDTYTITVTDTTVAERVRNQPGDRDNGVIYPSSRTLNTSRTMVQRDSIVERTYPNFIRMGLFEGIGTIGSSINGAPSTNTGLFGLFHDIDETFFDAPKDTSKSRLFSGEIYRLGIAEWRLRIFDEDPGWSWGITAFEFIRPDDGEHHTLMGAGVLYLRKRFYFKSTIPYAAITPFFSVAFAPSTYAHAGVSADLGSIGGVNLRVYGGGVWGVEKSFVFENGMAFPYLGIGVSVFDFLNREEELEVEWKYHEHSGWDLSLVDVVFAKANVERSIFQLSRANAKEPILSGGILRLASATLALPVLDYRLTLGTSLLTGIGLGMTEFSLGVLPLRTSYVWHPFQTDLVIEPFVEGAIAPGKFVHLGIRSQITIAEQVSLILQAGYVSGNTGSNAGFDFEGRGITGVDDPRSFSAIYFGFGAAFFDRMFERKELRYGKGYPHE